MAYIGFDLDETLGRFSVPDGHIYFLMPDALYRGLMKHMGPFPDPSPELREKLEAAFQTFATCLADKEPDLGMLRPGILKIIKKLADLKEEGRVKAILVYSNNGNLGCLHLATSMIEYLLGKPGLFCNRIDWWNNIRSGPGKDFRGSPGQATKTARVLRESFIDPRCGEVESFNQIPIKNLYFFDDLTPVHPDLYNKLGPQRYFKVNPYKQDVDFSPVDECFEAAIKSQDLDTNQEYLDYIYPILKSAVTSFPKEYSSIRAYLDLYNNGYVSQKLPFTDDTDAILNRLDTLFPPLSKPNRGETVNYGLNYFPVVDGGRRKKYRRRHKTLRKQSKKVKRTRKN